MLQDVANGIVEKQYAKNMEVAMLKITLKPGQYVNIGDDIRVVFAGGTGNNIRLLIDAPREVPIARNTGNAIRREERILIIEKLLFRMRRSRRSNAFSGESAKRTMRTHRGSVTIQVMGGEQPGNLRLL